MRTSSIIGGIILIGAGLLFLILPFFPELADSVDIGHQWPLIIVSVGILFFIGALLGSPPLAVPGSLIVGLGLILYYQNLNNAWETWAYTWTLIPGFVGVGQGIRLSLEGRPREGLRKGGRLVLISLILLLVFASLVGDLASFGLVGSILLIGAGFWLLARSLFRSRGARDS